MQGLGGQCDSGAPHGFTAVRAAEGDTGSQLCQLPPGDVRSGPADQLPVGNLRYGEPTVAAQEHRNTHRTRQLAQGISDRGGILIVISKVPCLDITEQAVSPEKLV